MPWGWALAAAALCAGIWLDAGGVSCAAMIGGGSTGLGMMESAGLDDGGLTAPATASRSNWMPCLMDARALSAIAADCPLGMPKDGSPALPGSTPNAVSDPDFIALGISVGVAAFDSAPLPPPYPSPASGGGVGWGDDFWMAASGWAVERLDDLIKVAENTDDPDKWWIIDPSRLANGDIYVKDAVPALAVVALLAAGFLVFGLARRRRRAAWVRRIKRNAQRQRPPFSS
jgi:hypothetical protein